MKPGASDVPWFGASNEVVDAWNTGVDGLCIGVELDVVVPGQMAGVLGEQHIEHSLVGGLQFAGMFPTECDAAFAAALPLPFGYVEQHNPRIEGGAIRAQSIGEKEVAFEIGAGGPVDYESGRLAVRGPVEEGGDVGSDEGIRIKVEEPLFVDQVGQNQPVVWSETAMQRPQVLE